jgi:hypothetical protein
MAEDVTRKEYLDEIRGIAADAIEEGWTQAGEDADEPNEEAMQEYVQQTVDGHQWIIYYGYPEDVLRFTDNKDAYIEEFGSIEATDTNDALAKMAYMAMMRDITDYIYQQAPHERPKPKPKRKRKTKAA